MDFLLKSWSRQQEPRFFNALWYSYLPPSFSPPFPQSWRLFLRNQGGSGEKQVSPATAHATGVAWVTHHFHFSPPLWERSLLSTSPVGKVATATAKHLSPLKCHHRDGGTLVSSSFSSASKLYPVPVVCWNLPSGRLHFYNLSLICEYLFKFALSRYFSDHGEWGWGRFTEFFGSKASSEVLFVYFWMHR